jgi:hypothetical protein
MASYRHIWLSKLYINAKLLLDFKQFKHLEHSLDVQKKYLQQNPFWETGSLILITTSCSVLHWWDWNSIQFPNTPCSSQSGNDGTCYTSLDCADRGTYEHFLFHQK